MVDKVDELMALCDKRAGAAAGTGIGVGPHTLPCLWHARYAESPTPGNLKAIFDDNRIRRP